MPNDKENTFDKNELNEAPRNGSEVKQRIDSLETLKSYTLEILKAAKKSVQIYTENLDPRVLNSREVEQALSHFVRSSRFVKVELLIHEERLLQGIDHRLVSLAQRYTSFISIKIIPKDYHENHFAFYLVDGRKIIYRTNAERFEAEYHEVPSTLIQQKSKYFNEIWQQSAPAVHLRALNL